MVWNNTLGGPTPQVPPNLHHGVYVRDLNTGQTILVSVRPDGTPSDHLVSLDPVISANGRYVAFTNWEDLDPNFPDAAEESLLDGPFADIFVRDLQTGLTHRASLPFPGGPAEESGGVATISADGRYVAYLNNNLIRLRDRVTGTTRVIDGVGGVPADGYSRVSGRQRGWSVRLLRELGDEPGRQRCERHPRRVPLSRVTARRSVADARRQHDSAGAQLRRHLHHRLGEQRSR